MLLGFLLLSSKKMLWFWTLKSPWKIILLDTMWGQLLKSYSNLVFLARYSKRPEQNMKIFSNKNHLIIYLDLFMASWDAGFFFLFYCYRSACLITKMQDHPLLLQYLSNPGSLLLAYKYSIKIQMNLIFMQGRNKKWNIFLILSSQIACFIICISHEFNGREKYIKYLFFKMCHD